HLAVGEGVDTQEAVAAEVVFAERGYVVDRRLDDAGLEALDVDRLGVLHAGDAVDVGDLAWRQAQLHRQLARDPRTGGAGVDDEVERALAVDKYRRGQALGEVLPGDQGPGGRRLLGLPERRSRQGERSAEAAEQPPARNR